MKTETNVSESTAASIADNPPDGHWTAPEVTVVVIIILILAVAAVALFKLFTGGQFRRN